MPAITATFRADLSQFRQALEQGQTVVTGFQRTTTQVNNDLKKFGNEFSGAQIIRQAETAAKAIEQLGGVGTLTSNEIAKLGPVAADAMAKLQALGREASPELQRLASEIKRVEDAEEQAAKQAKAMADAQKGGVSSDLLGTLGKLGPAITGAFSVGAIVSFGKSLVDMASQIHDVAEQTGLSTDAVQELKYAATQTGTTFETVTKSIDKLSKNLEDGNKNTTQSLKELGLSLVDLQRMTPDQAFTAVAEAIKQVPDPMKQTQLAMELFGKSGAQILPAIKEGMSDLREEAHKFGQVLDKEAIDSLEAFGDKFDRLMTGLKVTAAESALAIGKSFSSLPNFVDVLQGYISGGAAGAAGAAVANSIADRAKSHTEDIALPKDTAASTAGLVEQLRQARSELARFTPEMRAAIAAGEEMHISHDKIAQSLAKMKGGFETSEQAVDLYVKQLKEVEKVSPTKAFTEAALKAKEYAQFIEKAGGVEVFSKQQREELNRVLVEGVDAYNALHRSGEPAYQTILNLANATTDWRKGLGPLKEGINELLGGLGKLDQHKDWVELVLGVSTPKGLQINNSGLNEIGTKLQSPIQVINDQLKEAQRHTVDWRGDLDSLAGVMEQLGRTGGGAFDHMIGELGLLIGLGSQAGHSLAGLLTYKNAITGQTQFDALKAFRTQAGDYNASSIASGTLQYTQAGLQAYSSISQATDVAGRGNRALRGAAAGAAIGTEILPGWGTAVGAAAGAIVGALRNPGFEQEMNRISKDFGVNISEELARNIDKLQDELFHGNRQAAEVYSLGDIMKEAGGLKASNVDTFTARLHDAFSLLQTGKFTVEQTQEVLEKNFGAFADYVTKSKDLASVSFQQIVALNHQMGVEAESVRAFVSQQAQTLGGDIAKLAGPLEEQYGGLGYKIKAAKQAVDDFNKANAGKAPQDLGVDDSKTQAQLNQDLNDLLDKQKSGAASAADELARLGVIALGSFNAAIRGGEDFLSAINDIGPGLDELIGLQKDLGIESDNAAVSQLEHYRDLVNGNQALVVSASALGEGLRALASIGGLTTDTLAAMEQQGGETFDRLVAAGFTENEALQQMKGFLLNVIQAHEQLGTPIDENTQKLIDQADALGLLKSDDPTDVLKQGFSDVAKAIQDLARALGADIPAAAQTAGDAIKNKIPKSIPVDVEFNVGDLPNFDYPNTHTPATGAARGGRVTAFGVSYLAAGGFPGGPRGTDVIPAWLTPGERVLNRDQAAAFDDLLGGGRITAPPPLPVLMAPSSASRDIRIEVPVSVDGRVIARANARYQASELRPYGAAR